MREHAPAALKTGDPIGDGAARGEHEQGRRETTAAQLDRDLNSVATREPEIEDDEIGLLLEGASESRFAVHRRRYVIALLTQNTLEE